jgi:hypothetical protein
MIAIQSKDAKQSSRLFSAGRITPTEAASLVHVAGGHARIIDLSEVDERLQAIEKQLKTLKES